MGTEFEYDENGRMTLKTYYRWNSDNERWFPHYRYFYDYDNIGRKILEISQKGDSLGNWVNNLKTEWYPDSAGIKTEWIDFTWTYVQNKYDWKVTSLRKIENVFDSAGNRIETTESNKVSENQWKVYRKEILSYNQAGRPVLDIMYSGPTLREDLRTVWDYDDSGQLVMETVAGLMARWEGPFPLKGKHKVFRYFDQDGDISKEFWFRWDFETQSYLPDGNDYFFYRSASSVQDGSLTQSLILYPNPTGGIVTVSGITRAVEVKVFSMLGTLLRSYRNITNSLDLSDLPEGAYLVLAITDNQPLFRTILIKQ